MKSSEFNQFVEEKLNDIRDILVKKGAEYVPEGEVEVSRFHNFEVSSALNGTTKEQALWGFVTKHIVSVADMVKDEPLEHSLAKWDEKIGDISVYMLLLHAMVYEAHGRGDLTEQAMKAYQEHVDSLAGNVAEDEDDIPKDSYLGEAFSEAERDYEEQVAEAESRVATEPVPNRITKLNLHDVALHTDPVNERAIFIHTDESNRPPEGSAMSYSNVGRNAKDEKAVKEVDSLGVEYGDSEKFADLKSEPRKYSRNGEKEAEIGELEFVGGVTPNIIQVENIFINSDEKSDHAKWLAAVTPPLGGAERRRS